MTNMIKRLLKFSGGKRNDLIASFVEMLPIMAILTVLSGLLTVAEGGVMAASTIWASLGIMVISIAGRIFFNNLSCVKRTLGSFAMCAQKRLEIGEHMKRVPMGYFSENRLGEIAAAATTTLGDIENNAVLVLERVAGGFIHAIVIGVWLLFYEWRIGLLMFAGLAVSMLVYAGIQRSAKRLSPRRQAAQASLVTCFLEYIQGMGVVKAFGLGERSGKAVNEAICESAKANIFSTDWRLSAGVKIEQLCDPRCCALSATWGRDHPGQVSASAGVQLHDLFQRGTGGEHGFRSQGD